MLFQWRAILAVAAIANAAQAIVVESVDEDADDAYRKVSDYFIVRESAKVRLRCEASRRLSLAAGVALETVQVRRNFTWTFRSRDDDGEATRAISRADSGLLDLVAGGIAVGGAAEERVQCRVFREYDEQRGSKGSSAEVVCHSSVLVNMFKGTVGTYECHSILTVSTPKQLSTNEESSDSSRQSVSLFLDGRPASIVIVTCIIVSTVVFIVLAGVCSRLAGHRFAWEYQELAHGGDGPYAMTRNNSMEETNLWLTRNSRYSSNASNISGLVFQTDSEGMARLLERLDHVEDPMDEGEESEEEGEAEGDDHHEEAAFNEDDEHPSPTAVKDESGRLVASPTFNSLVEAVEEAEEADKEVGDGNKDAAEAPHAELSDVHGNKAKTSSAAVGSNNRLGHSFRGRNRAFSESVSKSRPVKDFQRRHMHQHHSQHSSPAGMKKNFSLLLSNNPNVYQSPVGSPRQTSFLERIGLHSSQGSDSKNEANLQRRRSMLGILPSGIGIGSGAIFSSDENMLEELSAIEKERRGTFGNNAASFRMNQLHGKAAPAPSIVVSSPCASGAVSSHGSHGGRVNSVVDSHAAHPEPIQEEANSSTDPSIKEGSG